MKGILNRIIDKLQEAFPPNRIMVVLAGPITAASVWLSAWVTANVPGVELPVGVIAGAMGLVGLIVVTLIYKWFDQWQRGESLTVEEDLNQAFDELDQATTMFFAAHGTVQGVGAALQDLHDRIAKGSINEAEVASGVSGILDVISDFVEDHSEAAPETVPAPPVEPPPPGPVEPPVPPADRPVE